MCPCAPCDGWPGLGELAAAVLRPEVRGLLWAVVVMLFSYLVFLGARGRERRKPGRREATVGEVVQALLDKVARLERDLERYRRGR